MREHSFSLQGYELSSSCEADFLSFINFLSKFQSSSFQRIPYNKLQVVCCKVSKLVNLETSCLTSAKIELRKFNEINSIS